jgi:hypothetical protein
MRSTLLACASALLSTVLPLPGSAEVTASTEISLTEAADQIAKALVSIVAVVHVRLDEVSLTDRHYSALAYIELDRQGYLQKKGHCNYFGCSFTETELALRYRPPAGTTQVRREWILSCVGRSACAEGVWVVARYQVAEIIGIEHHDRVARVQYVVEAHLTQIARVLWPTMSEKVSSTQTASLERTEMGWKLMSVWIRQ